MICCTWHLDSEGDYFFGYFDESVKAWQMYLGRGMEKLEWWQDYGNDPEVDEILYSEELDNKCKRFVIVYE